MITTKAPKLRIDSCFLGELIDRYSRVSGAVVAAIAEMCATGVSARKAEHVAWKLSVLPF